MPDSEKNVKGKTRGSKGKAKNYSDNQIVENDEKVGVSGHSPEFESTNFTRIRLSQYYDPEMDTDLMNSTGDRVPSLPVHPKSIKAAAVNNIVPYTSTTNTSIVLKPST